MPTSCNTIGTAFGAHIADVLDDSVHRINRIDDEGITGCGLSSEIASASAPSCCCRHDLTSSAECNHRLFFKVNNCRHCFSCQMTKTSSTNQLQTAICVSIIFGICHPNFEIDMTLLWYCAHLIDLMSKDKRHSELQDFVASEQLAIYQLEDSRLAINPIVHVCIQFSNVASAVKSLKISKFPRAPIFVRDRPHNTNTFALNNKAYLLLLLSLQDLLTTDAFVQIVCKSQIPLILTVCLTIWN